jgi:hypothetical protein
VICHYKGCGIFGDSVKGGACPVHREAILSRQRNNKRAKRAATAGKPIDVHPFKMQRNAQVLKVASYYKHVYAPAAESRSMVMSLYEGNLYDTLRLHGIALKSDMVTITTELMNYITGRWKKNKYRHEQLFTGFKKDGTIKFISKTSKKKKIKQRWVSQASDTFEMDINMINEIV